MPWLSKPRSPQEADHYSRLNQGQQVLLIGDTLSVQIVFNNLTGRNFQPREKPLVSWRVLKEISEEYRNYLRYMEEDLGTTIDPDNLSIEVQEKEEFPV